MPGGLQISEETADGVRIIAASGELDAAGAPALSRSLNAAIDAGRADLVVDLSGLRFLDSTGLGVLLGAKRRLARTGARLQIVCAVPAVLRIFQTTRLDRDFTIVPSRAHALQRPPDPSAG